jgi:hypothetical protein
MSEIYVRPYRNLVKEGLDDINFFKLQLKNFQNKLAVRAFCDIRECKTIDETIKLLKILVKACELHQKHLERMEQSEYKAYLHKLGICGKDTEGQEVRPGTTDQKPAVIKREITWIAKG